MILGKACDLIDAHQESKKSSVSSPVKTGSEHKSKDLAHHDPVMAKEETEQQQSDKEAFASSAKMVTSAEDMALLEAKLQTIECPMRVLPPPQHTSMTSSLMQVRSTPDALL